jgi:dGTPase
MEMKWENLLSEVRTGTLMSGGGTGAGGNDYRSPFVRDYDRSIFSTPVRRLQDKTQVFPMEPHDAVRTRLTHSLEVSTVARDIGREVARQLSDKGWIDQMQSHAVETIAATCGLIHDMGNPPFGHAGELAISEWFNRKGDDFFVPFDSIGGKGSQLAQDFLRFDGNAQTIRLITRLQLLINPTGMNFTAGTLSAACKYVVPSNSVDRTWHEASKPGYFASEQEIVRLVRGETGTGVARNPITYLVEASDDIVYSVVDIEDSIKSGVTDWWAVEQELKGLLAGTSAEMILESFLTDAQMQVGAIKEWLSRKDAAEATSQLFRIRMIKLGVDKAVETFMHRYESIMAGDYHGELLYDTEPSSSQVELVKACKEVARRLVYRSPKVLRLEIAGRKVIQDLLDLFWEGAQAYPSTAAENEVSVKTFPGKLYRLMSKNYRRVFESSWADSDLAAQHYGRMQLITYYICGMTDTFACTLHHELTTG